LQSARRQIDRQWKFNSREIKDFHSLRIQQSRFFVLIFNPTVLALSGQIGAAMGKVEGTARASKRPYNMVTDDLESHRSQVLSLRAE
jgi:hypothetical protein